jgi:hypothetical protein
MAVLAEEQELAGEQNQPLRTSTYLCIFVPSLHREISAMQARKRAGGL